MASRFLIRSGAGAPTNSNLLDKEIGYDTTNKKLYINDSGVIRPITKSAYEYAVEGGFVGTEQEFAQLLNLCDPVKYSFTVGSNTYYAYAAKIGKTIVLLMPEFTGLSGVGTTTLFTLATAYRPSVQRRFDYMCFSSAGYGTMVSAFLIVETTGKVKILSNISGIPSGNIFFAKSFGFATTVNLGEGFESSICHNSSLTKKKFLFSFVFSLIHSIAFRCSSRISEAIQII